MRLPAPSPAGAKALALLALLFVVPATPAFADATVFIGSTMTPANRPAKGAAIGVSLLIIGFEFEYADTGEDVDEGAPSVRTGMGNVLLQTPFPLAGMQFYATLGAGGYRERLGEDPVVLQETHLGINTGGGVKVSLIGPVRVRLDYRLFSLRGEPLHSTVHRIYAGFNLAF
ncbi:MAG TPA: hypothetical protein VIX63_13415 [Vicinamibacterales bacterium]